MSTRTKSAIASHSTPTRDGTWDAAAVVAALPSEAEALRYAHAWVDPDGDADAKAAYKFPHHDGRAAVLAGCSAGIAVLNGSRGGADIPDADREGVHRHLARHLRDADREAPELRGRSVSRSFERKLLTLEKAAVSEVGEFSGYANVFGIIDHGGDRVMPGAFAKAIPEFLRDGFVSWGHDWTDPVAMPVEAHEDEHGLFIRARFHSIPDAQAKRTIAAERLANGLSMGLSIGYGVEDERPGDDGARELHVIYPLFETGLVLVPMNSDSLVSAVKSGSPADRLPYAEYLDWLLAEVEALRDRTDRRAGARDKVGRVLSAVNRQRIGAIADGLRTAADDLVTLLAETEPEKDRLVREARAIAGRLGIVTCLS